MARKQAVGGLTAFRRISTPIIYVTSHAAKALDPGCRSAKASISSMQSKMNADATNLDAMKSDLSTIVSQLDDAASKSTNAAARDAIKKVSGDFKELQDDLNNGKAPASDLLTRIEADGNAADKACGTLGS